ncbi:AIPR family protein [Aliarcobacter thereius]|uniref:AIPR family protein n=1 Tax=Aliarcobacter thereius TaxID=544718 RepID=UPI0010FD3794|nr:AIPR family protein [Aliarcobacter thereius]TLT07246.1 AIPR family protein [Aliarcobacter thereius]
MASLNQFKLVSQKSESYFRLLEKELNKTINLDNEYEKEKFGFYIFILECITNIKDINNLEQLITDKFYNQKVHNNNYDDFGIDAIYINDEEKEISLFNFKYREKFSPDSKISQNDISISTKFVNAIITSKLDDLNGKLREFATNIIDAFSSKDTWKFKLYMVSNESKDLDIDLPNIVQLKELYDLEIISISLSKISDFMSLRPESINAKLLLEKESILSYSEDNLSTTNSYIIKLPIIELIRITCNDKKSREEYNLEDYKKLDKFNLSYGVLFDNVRGYLGETKYNKNIFETLKKEPNRFFMYNNGITITTKNINAESVNAKKKMKFELEDIQIVNGGQTLRTLHKFKSENIKNIDDYLSQGEILVRIFKTGNNIELTSKIAEYTNSQNAISAIDLKSISYIQIQIEQFLEEENIIYSRKAGDIGTNSTKEYKHKFSMEKLAQLLFAIKGNPEKSSNQKKQIFEKYYNNIFNDDFDLTISLEIIKKYYEILGVYNTHISKYEVNDQKIFYIIYLINILRNQKIIDIINKFESTIDIYKKDDALQSSRKLIQKGFKELVDKEFGITQ